MATLWYNPIEPMMRLSDLRLAVSVKRRTPRKTAYVVPRSVPPSPIQALARSVILNAIRDALELPSHTRPTLANAEDAETWLRTVTSTAQNRLREWTPAARTRENSTAQNSKPHHRADRAAALKRYEALHFLAEPGPLRIWADSAGIDWRAISGWAGLLLLAHESRWPKYAYCRLT